MTEYVVPDHPLYGKLHVLWEDEGISQHIVHNRIWEDEILELLVGHIKPQSTFVDIGAHVGCHSVGVLKRLPQHNVRVIAFEPQPLLYELLKKNLELHGKSTDCCYQKGLADQTGVTRVVLPDYVTRKNPGGWVLYLEQNNPAHYPVQITTLDTYHLDQVSVIKIDVEGLEYKVLQGARETILRCRPVMVVEILGGVDRKELNQQQQTHLRQTIAFIEGLGYSVQQVSYHDYLCLPHQLHTKT